MARGTISITFPAVLIQGENMIKLILDYNILDAYKSESSYCGAQWHFKHNSEAHLAFSFIIFVFWHIVASQKMKNESTQVWEKDPVWIWETAWKF